MVLLLRLSRPPVRLERTARVGDRERPAEGAEYEAAAILSGLSTYLASSFRDDRSSIQALPIPAVWPDAPEEMRVMAVESAGMRGAGALWLQRERIGRGPVDQAAVGAWLAVAPGPDAFGERFIAAFASALGGSRGLAACPLPRQ